MVGVPGRSKACNTCLGRKIKCDLGRPSCGNCAKSKRTCGGYVRKTAYIFSDTVALADGAADSDDDDGTLIFQGRWKGAAAKKVSGRSLQRSAKSSSSAPPLLPRPETQQLVGLVGARCLSVMPSLWQQLHHVFVSAYVPRNGAGAADSTTLVTGNWPVQLGDRPCTLPALQTSVAALALAQIGRQHRDVNAAAQSVQLYAKSLENLREAIARPATRLADETLATCTVLGVYELTNSRRTVPVRKGSASGPHGGGSPGHRRNVEEPSVYGTTAHDSHIAGFMALLRLRGPDGINTPLSRNLFLIMRRRIVLEILNRHTDTFLAHPEWREKPWAGCPKDLLDQCLDCILDLPAIQRQLDSVRRHAADRGRVLSSCRAVIQNATAVSERLDAWHADFQRSVPGPLCWPTPCTLESRQDDDPVSGKPFPVSLRFPSFNVAYMVMTHWGGVMVSSWTLWKARDRMADVLGGGEAGEEEEEAAAAALRGRARADREAWMAVTGDLCQMTEFFADEAHGRIGLCMALTLLEGVRAMFVAEREVRRRELAWLEEMIARMTIKLNANTMVM